MISVRDLIGLWGYQRRGYYVVSEIKSALQEEGLTSEPDFTRGWIDEKVALLPIELPAVVEAESSVQSPSSPEVSDSQTTDSSFMGGALTFADLDTLLFEGPRPPLASVSESDSLAKAQSIMMRFDFSQLPVLNGTRTLRGAISWESIARAGAHRPAKNVADCMVAADVLKHSDDVLTNVPKITANGFVLTRNSQQEIIGIVTTSDLAAAFEALSGPFLLLGICEQLLRNIAASSFPDEEIRRLCPPRFTGRAVDGLTLGELKSLFDSAQRWEELNWPGVDPATFRANVGVVLELRNREVYSGGWKCDTNATF